MEKSGQWLTPPPMPSVYCAGRELISHPHGQNKSAPPTFSHLLFVTQKSFPIESLGEQNRSPHKTHFISSLVGELNREMSLIGRVHPDCVNVSNPYHECTENCLRKIQEGKGRKTKKKSDNGSTFKDGEFKKKAADDRRASNPYHDPEYYLQQTGGAKPRGDIKEPGSILDVPILGRKKERSRPKPPQELYNVPGQGLVYHSDAPSSKEKVNLENGSILDGPIFSRRKQGSQPKTSEELEDVPVEDSVLDDPIFGRRKHESKPKHPKEIENVPDEGVLYPSDLPSSPSKDKVKLQNGEHKSYSPPISEVKDPSFNKEQVQSSLLVPPSGIITVPEYPKDPPENGATDVTSELPGHGEDNENLHHSVPNLTVNNAGEGAAGSASDSRSFSFSGTLQPFEESDEEETRSVNSDSSVSVGKYRVKGSFSSILQSIVDKYGDIAASCQLESIVIRSYYLECVCYVVQELKKTSIKQLTKPKVKEMLSMLKDVESSGMDVGWLRLIINKCAEATELVSQHRAFEAAKANCDRDIESTKKELESQMEVLAQKEKEVAETRAHLRELELKSSALSETVSNMKSKVDNLQTKPLLDKVL
ncbi:hypothetical protein L3X38_044280 [Prunus dulcis]|uniref:Phospholipase-like protein family n=2 Tax=Prunus dulcis TaxID=3755 RepID=A0AAD4UYE9_PRUDU|nr:hypothetical protein L3X38_044280 [Prunus dulcis]